MPDISMCPGGECPARTKCARFLAKPSEYRQAYFLRPPYNAVVSEHGGVSWCEFWWDAGKAYFKLRTPEEIEAHQKKSCESADADC